MHRLGTANNDQRDSNHYEKQSFPCPGDGAAPEKTWTVTQGQKTLRMFRCGTCGREYPAISPARMMGDPRIRMPR